MGEDSSQGVEGKTISLPRKTLPITCTYTRILRGPYMPVWALQLLYACTCTCTHYICTCTVYTCTCIHSFNTSIHVHVHTQNVWKRCRVFWLHFPMYMYSLGPGIFLSCLHKFQVGSKVMCTLIVHIYTCTCTCIIYVHIHMFMYMYNVYTCTYTFVHVCRTKEILKLGPQLALYLELM